MGKEVILRAFYPKDGSSVIESDGKLKYIEFPYTSDREYPCSIAQLNRLIIRQNFTHCEMSFDTGNAAIEFLKSKANETPKPVRNESKEMAIERFQYLPAEDLQLILNSVERIYIQEEKDFERANRALLRMLQLKAVKEDSALYARVLKTLDQVLHANPAKIEEQQELDQNLQKYLGHIFGGATEYLGDDFLEEAILSMRRITTHRLIA